MVKTTREIIEWYYPGVGRRLQDSHYLKVERSYENFHKQKGHKVKKQLPFVYMEKNLSISRSKIQYMQDLFISFTMTETLNYGQFYVSVQALLCFLDTFQTDAKSKHTK